MRFLLSKFMFREIQNEISLVSAPNRGINEHKQGFLVPSMALLGLVGNTLSVLVLHSPGVDMKVVKIQFPIKKDILGGRHTPTCENN